MVVGNVEDVLRKPQLRSGGVVELHKNVLTPECLWNMFVTGKKPMLEYSQGTLTLIHSIVCNLVFFFFFF